KLEKMPRVYLSEKAVKIDAVTEIDDLYEALLQEEAAGNLVINRHENMSEEEKSKWHAVVEKDVENRGLKSKEDGDYAAFIHEHFPEII
ncbi:MAG: hypothetical protein IJW24_03980, partial [Clostridia bacterium]|nr:hypothetical protein [Clostridia bacterium]